MSNQKLDNANMIDWFFCDDIREETQGKVSYMGVYGDSILFSEVPATLPKMFICMKMELKGKFAEKVYLKIMQPGGLLFGPIEVKLAVPDKVEKSNKVRIHLGIVPFNVQKTGSLELLVSLDGKKFENIGNVTIGLISNK